MVARKIGPALAVGCTCVIKVPAETPYTNLAIIEVRASLVNPTETRLLIVARKTGGDPGRSLERHHHRQAPSSGRPRIDH